MRKITKHSSAIIKHSSLRAFALIGLIFLFFVNQEVYAQTKILAKEVMYTSGDDKMTSLIGCGSLVLEPCYAPTVLDPNNALIEDNTYARLLASPGLALDLGSYNGIIELKFQETIPANQWSYVRIDGNNDLLRALLGGSLGELLGGVLGAVLIGNQEITIDARMGSNSVLSRNSNQSFDTDRVKLLEDADGNFNLAIRPDQAYDRIRITNDIGTALGLGNEVILDVYYAYTYDPTEPATNCGRPLATSFDGGGGINLNLLNLGEQNLGNAIDEDEDTYSVLDNASLLGLSVAGSLSQYFYFPTVSSETATLSLRLGANSSSVLNLDLLGATEVIFYNGADIVHERSLESSLLHNTEALDLLTENHPFTINFGIGKAFDRVELRLNAAIGLNLISEALRVYDIQRYDDSITGCENPNIASLPAATPDPFIESSCAGDIIDFENVDFAHRAVDGNNETYATLYASSGSLLGSPAFDSFIELDLGSNLAANTTTYVRIGYDEDVLDALLGGSLGKLLGDALNDLVLGNQYIQVEALMDTNLVLDQSSSNSFEGNADGVVTIVQDNEGRYYLAITPNEEYNRIRISNRVLAALATGKYTYLNVYNACFEIGTDPCFPPNFTSYRGDGLQLSVAQLSEVGVKDPYKAISLNSSEYSEISLGVAGVVADVYQSIYFNDLSKVDDHALIRLMIEPSSALELSLLGAYKIKFYNGDDQVGIDYTLQDGLFQDLNLLDLFNSGGSVTLDIAPGVAFDRIDIGAETTVGLSTTGPLRIYSVKRYGTDCPLTSTPSPFVDPSCSTELVGSQNAHEVQNLFDDDFDSYATLVSDAGSILSLNAYEGFVEMKYPQEVNAGTTTYIRIDFDEGILEKLVGGSLGNIVSGLLDGLVLGNHYFEVEVKNNGTLITSASSNTDSAGGNNDIRVVQDKDGRYYLAITPNQAYDSVKITDKTDSALGILAQPNTMNVYGMCYETSTSCSNDFMTTSYEYEGLSLSVNDLGGAGVSNPEYALNSNSQQYSEISHGTLGVGTSTKQWIFFNSPSTADDVVQIKFSTESGVADVDVLGGLEIKAYMGEVEVAVLDWQNGLVNGVNVLQLLTNNDAVDLPFKPGVEFDRISVGIRSILDVSVFPPVHLQSVTRCNVNRSMLMTNPMIRQRVK